MLALISLPNFVARRCVPHAPSGRHLRSTFLLPAVLGCCKWRVWLVLCSRFLGLFLHSCLLCAPFLRLCLFASQRYRGVSSTRPVRRPATIRSCQCVAARRLNTTG